MAGTVESTAGGFRFPDGTTQTTAASGSDVRQLIQDFVVASGESVTAGDVVQFVDGYVQQDRVFGSEVVFNSAGTHSISAAALSSTQFVVAYQDEGNSFYSTAVIGDVSGTDITYGDEVVFNAASTHYISVAALSSTKFVVAYQDAGNGGQGTAVIGDVSGSGSSTTISYGSEYVFNEAWTDSISAAALFSGQFVVAYQDVGNSYYGTAVIGDVSGTVIDFGSEYVFNSANNVSISAAALSSIQFVVAYQDEGNFDYGTAVIGKASCNMVGIARESKTAGQTVPVIIDGVSDVHSGLTPGEIYYSDTSGGLTTSKTPRKIGLAISATELLLDIDIYGD